MTRDELCKLSKLANKVCSIQKILTEITSETPANIVFFNTVDPNIPGTVFVDVEGNPGTQLSNSTLYVSSINGSQWTSDTIAYQTYIAPSTPSTEFNIVNTTIDAGGNKTTVIERYEEIRVVNSTTARLRVISGTRNLLIQATAAGNPAITTSGTDFVLGTTDAHDMSFKANSVEVLRLLASGAIKLPTTPATGTTADFVLLRASDGTLKRIAVKDLTQNLLELIGTYDASGGTYPTTGGSGTGGAILKADAWIISVPGTLPTGRNVKIGDLIISEIDTPGQTQANWGALNFSLGYVPVNVNDIGITVQAYNSFIDPTSSIQTQLNLALKKEISYSASDTSTALTVSTSTIVVYAECAMTITDVMISLGTVQTSGALFQVDIKKNGTTIFSTKPTIDNGETTSLTALTPAVLSTTTIAKGDAITTLITQVGDGTAKQLGVSINGIRL